jgi:hypothetical protein
MSRRSTPKPPDVEIRKETVQGIEFTTTSYGSYHAALPLATVEIFWRGSGSQSTDGGYVINLNGSELKWREGLTPPSTIDETVRRLILVLKQRASKLAEILSKTTLPEQKED